MVTLCAKIYSSHLSHVEQNNNALTAVSYLNEKIRSANSADCIHKEEFFDCDALVIETSSDGTDYMTYIYVYNGSLMEAYVVKGTDVSLGSGNAILTLESMSIDELSDKLFCFTCTDADGNTVSADASHL